MNKFKKVASTLLILGILVTSLLVTPAQGSIVQAEETTSVNLTTANLVKGKSLTLKLTNAKGKVSWSSGNKKIASVNQNGKVTAKRNGIVDITGHYNNKSYKCRIYIRDSKLKISKSTINVPVGKTINLKVVYKLSKNIYIFNQNSKIAKCKWSRKWKKNTTNMIITGRSAGQTKVLIYDKNRYFMLTINVTDTTKSS